MKLTEEQIAFYNENGYLKIENYLCDKEIDILYSELPKTIEKDSPRIILEDNGSVRSVFAPHFVNDIYKRLGRLERFIVPSEQLLGSKVYLHQYKINTKKGLKGDWWEWHQDFPYWHIDDGISNPELVSIMLYLQDTDSSNGALLLIPKSHKLGIAKFEDKDPLSLAEKMKYNDHHKTKDYLSSLNSNIKFTVNHDLVKELSIANSIVTASGKKGTVLFFHGNIFHASNINLTPFDRDAVIITYNSINNLPGNTKNPRPEFLVGRNYEPIKDLEAGIYMEV
jgi:ectoine hydroxylase